MTRGKVWELLGKVSSLLRRHEDMALPLPMGVAFLNVTLQTTTVATLEP